MTMSRLIWRNDDDSDDVMIMAVYFWAKMIGASMEIIFDYATKPVI